LLTACFVDLVWVVSEVQPEIWAEVTRKSAENSRATDGTDATDEETTKAEDK